MSKMADPDGWTVNQNIFMYFDKRWGPFTYDRFASDSNAKCKKFNSKYLCPSTNGIDAFQQEWRGENNWLVPPIPLITKTLLYAKEEKCHGTLVVPKWIGSSFWPLIKGNKELGFEDFVKDYVEYITPKNFFQPSTSNTRMFKETFPSNVLVMKIDYRTTT